MSRCTRFFLAGTSVCTLALLLTVPAAADSRRSGSGNSGGSNLNRSLQGALGGQSVGIGGGGFGITWSPQTGDVQFHSGSPGGGSRQGGTGGVGPLQGGQNHFIGSPGWNPGGGQGSCPSGQGPGLGGFPPGQGGHHHHHGGFHPGGSSGGFSGQGGGHYHVGPGAGRPPVQPVFTDAMPFPDVRVRTFGAHRHIHELSANVRYLANHIAFDMYYNYQLNPGFRTIYAKCYSMRNLAYLIHDMEHTGHHLEMTAALHQMDALFHELEHDIHGWRREHRIQIGQGDLFSKMRLLEGMLHQLMYDAGVRSQFLIQSGSAPPLPGIGPGGPALPGSMSPQGGPMLYSVPSGGSPAQPGLRSGPLLNPAW